MNVSGRALVISAIAALASAACGTIRVKVTMKAEGRPDNLETGQLTFTRGAESVSSVRLKELGGRPESEILRDVVVQLRADVEGNPNDLREAYHLLVVMQEEGRLAGGTSPEREFVVNRVGDDVVHLTLRRGDSPREGAVSGRRHVGTATLAIVQDGDRVVPWQVAAGDERCFSTGSDCVDMETITRTLFETTATAVDDAVRDNVPSGSVTRHQLHFVPRVVHEGFERNGVRARGVGFVYRATIETLVGTCDVFVPISILFIGGGQEYVARIDPLGFQPGDLRRPENLARILVKGSPGMSLGEGLIRDQIVQALRAQALPELIPGVTFEETLLTAFNAVTRRPPPSGPLFPSYEVILLPDEENATLNSTVVWRRGRVSDTQQEHPVRLVFLE